MTMSSRERMLRTISGQPADYTPLCLLLCTELLKRCRDDRDFFQCQVDLGLDAVMPLPDLPMRYHPAVTSRVWQEPGEENPLLHKRYQTPAGELEVVVEMRDWPHGPEIPLISDYVISRGRKPLLTKQSELAALAYLLTDPTAEDIAEFRRGAAEARAFADKNGLATRAGFFRLSDMICWLAGCEQFATWGLTDPELLAAALDLVARWQERRIEILLEARPDIFIDAQWYATTFLSPDLYDRFISPPLQRRIDMAHGAGAKFLAIATTTVTPFFPILKRLGIDALFGVDPLQGSWDLQRAKAELGDQVCLLGGVNGYLTIVDGTPADVERAVTEAMTTLAPGGRFVLSAVDNVRIDGPDTPAARERVWRNLQQMFATWRRLR